MNEVTPSSVLPHSRGKWLYLYGESSKWHLMCLNLLAIPEPLTGNVIGFQALIKMNKQGDGSELLRGQYINLVHHNSFRY